MTKLLIVDDDVELTDTIKKWLTRERYTIDVVHTGQDGLDHLRNMQYDVVILDWTLPDFDGLDICQQFRKNDSTTPILMLTGRAASQDKVTGLDAGADDYLTKPFSMNELSARIRALIRRSTPGAPVGGVLQAGSVTVDTRKYRVMKGNTEIHLLPREFALLEFLMRHPDEVFSVDALLSRVWPTDAESTAPAIRSCVKRIREKLDDDDVNSLIENIPKVGYRLRPNP